MAISDKTNENIVKSIPRWINEISSSVDIPYELLYDTTLNSKYNIFPGGVDGMETSFSVPKIRFFGLGVSGCYNVDDSHLSAPYRPAADELDLYEPIPLRCVPVDEDLSAAERSMYRMRKERTINGQRYYCYYLKKLTVVDNSVQLTRTNPVTHEEEPFELSSDKLNPIPTKPTVSGETEGVITEVNASVRLELNWTGAEVLEAINVLYNGDMRYAKISEIGIYSGVDYNVTSTDGNGSPLQYTESIYTALNYKICNIGSVVTSASYDGSRIFKLTNGNTLLLS